ncbi:unnamed protein product, partial [marine sediment metagenome]
MDNPLEHWREVISRQKPRKFSGAFGTEQFTEP